MCRWVCGSRMIFYIFIILLFLYLWSQYGALMAAVYLLFLMIMMFTKAMSICMRQTKEQRQVMVYEGTGEREHRFMEIETTKEKRQSGNAWQKQSRKIETVEVNNDQYESADWLERIKERLQDERFPFI